MEVLVRCEPLSNPISYKNVVPARRLAGNSIRSRPDPDPTSKYAPRSRLGMSQTAQIRKLQPQTPLVGRDLLSLGIDSRRLREKGEINERDFLKRFSGTIFSFAGAFFVVPQVLEFFFCAYLGHWPKRNSNESASGCPTFGIF